MMTFGQFVEKCRAAGVTDDTPLFWIDYTPTERQDTDVHVSTTTKNGVRITHWPYQDAEGPRMVDLMEAVKP